MSNKLLPTLLLIILISLISIIHATAQEPSNTDYFDHIALFSDIGITAFMLNTTSTADNGENATE